MTAEDAPLVYTSETGRRPANVYEGHLLDVHPGEPVGNRELAVLARALLDAQAARLYPQSIYRQTVHVMGYDPLG